MSIEGLQEWWAKWNGTNIHRSLAVYFEETGEEPIFGPLHIDIDGNSNIPFQERIEDARAVCLRAVKWFQETYRLTEADLRCYFSGAKGFHLSVRPTAVGINDSETFWKESERIRTNLILALRGECGRPKGNNVSDRETVIDPKHDFVRLVKSINSWHENGTTMSARKTRLSLQELEEMETTDIIARSSTYESASQSVSTCDY